MMQISPDQGAFMTLLTKHRRTRGFAVEVGTFTGYSSICIARGLADGGRLLCCDVSEEWTAIAREHWEKAGVADRIELKIGPAADTLRALPADPPIDLAFIDADKPGYRTYYEEIVERLRPGGLVLLDNVLWSGNVVDDERPEREHRRDPRRQRPRRRRRPRRGRDAPDRRRPHHRPEEVTTSGAVAAAGRLVARRP